ncbi:hypothetical protein [Phenylobacterium sp.]|uniref:hypothetical protein n=1 Tax=Phenylobacterium sp. TaxID=1871053 RepID=UPI002FE10728
MLCDDEAEAFDHRQAAVTPRTAWFVAAADGETDEPGPSGETGFETPEPEAGPMPESLPQPEPPPAPEAFQPPPAMPALPDVQTISAEGILADRPDVLKAFYTEYYGRGNDPHSAAWSQRVGAATPEAYALYWYARHGKYEGYAQSPTTAQDNISLSQILIDRPDVLRAYYEAYYGPGNDRNSSAWMKRVGGETAEDYARYWYEKYGRWEGYAQTERQAAQTIDIDRLLADRPDVFRAYYEGFYGPGNDRKSSAWVDRVGGDTLQDYAKYWYVTHGKSEGYSQAPAHAPAPPQPEPEAPWEPDAPGEPAQPVDPSLDPWNHPAIYPDWRPPYEGWTPPDSPSAAPEEDLLSIGRGLSDPDPFG